MRSEELYNLDADRAEMHDLSQEHPGKRQELVKLWEDWAREIQVAFPRRFNMYEYLKEKKR